MLSINGSNVDFTARSVDEEGNVLALMDAYYHSADNVYFGITIRQNSELIDSDFSAFKAHIFACQENIEAIMNNGEDEE